MDVQTDDFRTIQFSWMQRQPNFITHGVPQSLRESSATGSIRISKKARLIYDKGVIPLNASILKGTAFLLQSNKHYDRRPVKEVTFWKTGDKTRSERLRHHQEFEIEIKLCNTTNW